MGYSRRRLNYLERITLSNFTRMMNMIDLIAISVETPNIDCRCPLKKEFTELVCMNPQIVLYPIVNQVDSYHSCVHSPLT